MEVSWGQTSSDWLEFGPRQEWQRTHEEAQSAASGFGTMEERLESSSWLMVNVEDGQALTYGLGVWPMMLDIGPPFG